MEEQQQNNEPPVIQIVLDEHGGMDVTTNMEAVSIPQLLGFLDIAKQQLVLQHMQVVAMRMQRAAQSGIVIAGPNLPKNIRG